MSAGRERFREMLRTNYARLAYRWPRWDEMEHSVVLERVEGLRGTVTLRAVVLLHLPGYVMTRRLGAVAAGTALTRCRPHPSGPT